VYLSSLSTVDLFIPFARFVSLVLCLQTQDVVSGNDLSDGCLRYLNLLYRAEAFSNPSMPNSKLANRPEHGIRRNDRGIEMLKDGRYKMTFGLQ